MNEIDNVFKKILHPIQYSNKQTIVRKIKLILDLEN